MFIAGSAHAAAHATATSTFHDLDFLHADHLLPDRSADCSATAFRPVTASIRRTDSRSYAALACIDPVNQSDQHGGQSVQASVLMAPGCARPFRKLFRSNLAKALEVFNGDVFSAGGCRELTRRVGQETGKWACLAGDNGGYDRAMARRFPRADERRSRGLREVASPIRRQETRKVKAPIRRSGSEFSYQHHALPVRARIPFSSLATVRIPRPRAVWSWAAAALADQRWPHAAANADLRSSSKIREGVSYNGGGELRSVQARLPRFPQAHVPELPLRSLDAPFNLKYYGPVIRGQRGRLHMGCACARHVNIVDPSREITCGRGNLSFTSVNLPRIMITQPRRSGLVSRGS